MKRLAFALIFALSPLLAKGAPQQDGAIQAIRALNWHHGPAVDHIASKATLQADSTLAFLGEADSEKFLKLTGNLPDPGYFIVLSPKDNWWATFSFNPIGYVKDGGSIDAASLLKQLKDRDPAENRRRKKLGIAPIHTIGWSVPPHYDRDTKRLEWGLKLRSAGKIGVDYTVRILGRTGVMNATLVSSPETLNAYVRSFKAVLSDFKFDPGQRYAQFKKGDKVAAYGLAALILGGAAAVATKKGFWAVIAGALAAAWKVVAAAVVGVLGWLRSLFKKKTA